MKSVKVFETYDGQLFKTEKEAIVHEETERIKQDISVFVETEFYQYKKSYTTIHTLTKNIIAWEKYKKEMK